MTREFFINRLHSRPGHRQACTLHVNVSSSGGPSVNAILFELLVVGRVADNLGNSYCLHTNDAVLIELPQSLALENMLDDDEIGQLQQAHTVEDRFHFCSLNSGLPRRVVTDVNNPFAFGNDPQYVLKWLRAFEAKTLGVENTDDFAPKTVPDLAQQEAMDVLLRFCPQAAHSRILACNFLRYLHDQLLQIENNDFLKNATTVRDGDLNMLLLVLQAQIELAKDFSTKAVSGLELDDQKGVQLSSGTGRFDVVTHWEKQTSPMILLNQTSTMEAPSSFGDISVMCFSKSKVEAKQRLFWNQVELEFKAPGLVIDYEKASGGDDDKLELLLRVFGQTHASPETTAALRHEIRQKLKRFQYALTFDNVLKMLAIALRVKSGIPVILVGETGCGVSGSTEYRSQLSGLVQKTSLIEYLAQLLGVHLEKVDVHVSESAIKSNTC